MSRLDFHLEFYSEGTSVNDTLKNEIDTRLRALAADHSDMIGASVAVKELSRDETPHAYQARVVAYIRPENIVAVQKAGTLGAALKGALEAVEQQVHQRREKFQTQWQQTEAGTDVGVYQLSARELYDTYMDQTNASSLLKRNRTDIASELMAKEGLDQEAAYYAADEILVYAQELVESS